jgi:hypothetical protein
MQLWQAIIASPLPMSSRMLMACLIIVTSTAKDNVYSCGKAHIDPLVAYSGSMCAFFCGEGFESC